MKKNSQRRIMDQYRGDSHAWYFGSVTNPQEYHAIREISKVLSSYDIKSFPNDAWD